MLARPQWWELNRALASAGEMVVTAPNLATVAMGEAVVQVAVEVESQDVKAWTEGGRAYEMRENRSYRVTATGDRDAALEVLRVIAAELAEFVVDETPSPS